MPEDFEHFKRRVQDEIRTTSRTGGEKGMKPQRYDLLPRPSLDMAAEVFAWGATKYDDHNWRRRFEWSKSYAAAMRHLTAFWDGEVNDPESGLPHVGHAMFHLMVLATWLREDGEGGEFDDRYVDDEDSEGGGGTIYFAPADQPADWTEFGYTTDGIGFHDETKKIVSDLAKIYKSPMTLTIPLAKVPIDTLRRAMGLPVEKSRSTQAHENIKGPHWRP